MKFFIALLTLSLGTILSAAEAAVSLFNGKDLTGWELIATPAAELAHVCRYKPDGVLSLDGKPSGYLRTIRRWSNYHLHAEWRWPAQPGNGGVLLHISSGPQDRVWPICLQVQTKNKSVGDLLPMAGATFAEALTPGIKAPTRIRLSADSERPAGEWNSCDITARAGSVEVMINGVLQNRVTNCSPAEGFIGFQFEGTPFELRRVIIISLD